LLTFIPPLPLYRFGYLCCAKTININQNVEKSISFQDAPNDIRLTRRIQRDAVERGRTLSEILTQYSATVRPMHDEFVEPSKYNADLILHSYDEDESVSLKRMDVAMKVICSHLKMETVRR
jgi:uridine kinase